MFCHLTHIILIFQRGWSQNLLVLCWFGHIYWRPAGLRGRDSSDIFVEEKARTITRASARGTCHDDHNVGMDMNIVIYGEEVAEAPSSAPPPAPAPAAGPAPAPAGTAEDAAPGAGVAPAAASCCACMGGRELAGMHMWHAHRRRTDMFLKMPRNLFTARIVWTPRRNCART